MTEAPVVPAFLALPFVLRALIRGWLGSPPTVRRAPERSKPSPPVPAEAWDALATHAAQCRQSDVPPELSST